MLDISSCGRRGRFRLKAVVLKYIAIVVHKKVFSVQQQHTFKSVVLFTHTVPDRGSRSVLHFLPLC